MRIFSRRQDDTSNSITPNTRVASGIGKVPGAGTASSDVSEAVTFPVAFTTNPIVVCQFAGFMAVSGTYNPTGVDDTWGGATFSAEKATTTGFTARGRRNDGGSFASTSDYYYSWIAIGE
jgi:hypothetical protein